MSLVGFKAQNHPQQVADAGAADDVDDRWTPVGIFDELHAEHHFTIDVAASTVNTKLPRFFDRAADGLAQPWTGEVVWCNPPYSALEAWVRKAIYEVSHGCRKVVMLLPANRTEQRWWQSLIEPIRDRGLGVRTRNLPGRPRFGTPSNPDGKWNSSCPFGVVVLIIEPCARCATPCAGQAPDTKGKER